jgi:hypothetical protein
MTNQCIDCGRPLNAGSTGGASGLRCMICKTARGLRLPERKQRYKARVERVKEVTTGAQGRILRRVWLIDRQSDDPARLAYVVRFDDGREKRCLTNEIERLA